MSENNDFTKKLALFEYLPNQGCMAGVRTVHHRAWSDVVRISEWVDVEFTPIPYAYVMPELISAIDKKIEEVEKEALAKVLDLKGQRAQLLCLPNGH